MSAWCADVCSSDPAAGHFWAARAFISSGRPDLVSPRLRSAARHVDSFYGLLARRSLGIAPPPRTPTPHFLLAAWKHVDQLPGARRPPALDAVGRQSRRGRLYTFV